MVSGRFLPGMPGRAIEAIFNAARGNETASGKLDSPESSSALVANAFGVFLDRAERQARVPSREQVGVVGAGPHGEGAHRFVSFSGCSRTDAAASASSSIIHSYSSRMVAGHPPVCASTRAVIGVGWSSYSRFVRLVSVLIWFRPSVWIAFGELPEAPFERPLVGEATLEAAPKPLARDRVLRLA